MLAPGVKVWASRNSWEHETFLCAAVYTAHNLPCVSALGHWLSRRRLLLLNTNPVRKPRRARLKSVPGKRILKF